MFNNKGQASSVFNILIAAVVSLAILGLLMGIMGGLSFTTSNDPDSVAKENLKAAIQNPFSGKIKEATFSADKKEININALASVTDIGADQIGLCLDDDLGTANFTNKNGIILYTGTKGYGVKILAYCAEGSEISDDDLTPYLKSGSTERSVTCDDSEKTCLVAVFRK